MQCAFIQKGQNEITRRIVHRAIGGNYEAAFYQLISNYSTCPGEHTNTGKGVWLARSSRSRNHKALAAVLVCAMTLGLAAIIARANAGPPGLIRWQNLPDNLTKGQETRGGLDIEIVPEGDGMKLIVPLRKKPGAAEE